MKFSISVLEPKGYGYTHFLYDLCKYFCYGIESAGHDCCILRNKLPSDRINIIVGAHNLTDPAMIKQIKQMKNYILVQTEVITDESIKNWPFPASFSDTLLPLLLQAQAVWTFIEPNIIALKKFGIDADLVLLGYHPLMEEIIHKKNKDIDFLFCGSITQHRKSLLDKLITRGGNIVTMFDDAAMYRNDLIARTRVNLAPNQGPGINHFGSGRVLYLVNNRSIAVVERCVDQGMYEQCFPFADTDKWVDLCMETLRRPDRDQLAEEYYERFKKIRMVDMIEPLLEKFFALDRASSPSATFIKKYNQMKTDNSANAEKFLHPQFKHKDAIAELTSIILFTHDRLEQTKKCIRSIRKHTPEPYEIIFVDNGSTDGTVKWLQGQVKENKNCRLIENKENVGLAKGCNQGIEGSQGNFILLLNNDVVVAEGWLVAMLDCLNRAPAAGIVGPMTNNCKGLQQIVSDEYRSVDYLDKYAVRFKEQYRHRHILCRKIARFCMLFKRGITEKIGLFDERFDTSDFADEDFCLRAALEGYKNYIAGDVFIHHHEGKAKQNDRNIIEKKWTLNTSSPAGKKLAILQTTELADDLYQRGKTDQAVETLINCLKLTPDAQEIYYELIRIFIESKNFSKAWEVIGSMPEAAKNDLQALEYAGYINEGLGLGDEAAVYANRMLLQKENYPAASNLQGVLAFKNGNKEKAADYFQKAIDVDPSYGEAHTNLGVLYWGMDQREEALTHLQKGFILSPTVPDISSLYYSVVSSLEIYRDAEDIFREAKSLFANNKNIVFLYIDTLIQQSKFLLAMTEIENAIVTFGLDEATLKAALTVREKIGPRQIKKASKKNTLSLCMIVKNEEKFLAQCLKSVRDIVDEMIVVDTGSTDRTKGIATVFGAKVFDFPWTGDFSAARNHSLAQATGDWIMILDADEVISTLDHKRLLKIIDRGKQKPVAFDIVTRNYLGKSGTAGWIENDGSYPQEEKGIGWYASNKVRLFRNNSVVRFENPVHELLEASLHKAKIPIEKCTIPIHHYGRLNQDKVLTKGQDYYLLGRKKLEERGGGDYAALRELAIQACEIGKFEDAIDLWHQALALRPNTVEALFNLAYNYIQIGKFQEALEAAKKSVELSPRTKDAVLNYALCAMLMGNVMISKTLLEESVSGENENPTMLAILGAAYFICKDKEKGLATFKKLAQKKVNPVEYVNSLLDKLFASGQVEYAELLIDAAISGNIATRDSLRFR